VFRRLDLSASGRTRVVLWTVFGTLGCIAAATWMDSFNFATLDDAQRLRSIVTDILAPLVIGGPLLFFFSTKLRQLAIAHERLTIYASTDSLTSVLNRGAFTTLVDAYLTQLRAQEHEVAGALLVVDADHFKHINDLYGHDRGDEALKIIAQTIKGSLRGADIVGRIGGEEFGVFLPGSNPLRAEAVAERIRQAISDAEFIPDGSKRRLSVSVGGAVFDRQVAFGMLYRTADQLLYEAKERGRNCVAMSLMRSDLPNAA
jgi:diguanylate cyclase